MIQPSARLLHATGTVNLKPLRAKPAIPFTIGAASPDVVRFGAQSELLAKYNMDPKTVEVVLPPNVKLPVSKAVLLNRLLQAHEHGMKNKLLGNLSNRHFSSNMMLENGTWALGTNIENSRDIGVLCGERSSLINAWNSALKKLKLSQLQTPEEVTKTQSGLKAKLIVMSGAQLADNGNPCGECQSWMATTQYFQPETLIANLETDKVKGGYKVVVKRIQDLLPLNGKTVPSLSDEDIKGLPVEYSEKAQAVLAQKKINISQLKDLMTMAKQAFLKNQEAKLAAFAGKNTAAAVLYSNQEMKASARFDFSARWFLPADLTAASQGVFQFKANQPQAERPTIEAVAYYGKDADQPSVASIGTLAQPYWGGNGDALVVVLEQNTLKVRTLKDYMPDIYISHFVPKE